MRKQIVAVAAVVAALGVLWKPVWVSFAFADDAKDLIRDAPAVRATLAELQQSNRLAQQQMVQMAQKDNEQDRRIEMMLQILLERPPVVVDAAPPVIR